MGVSDGQDRIFIINIFINIYNSRMILEFFISKTYNHVSNIILLGKRHSYYIMV